MKTTVFLLAITIIFSLSEYKCFSQGSKSGALKLKITVIDTLNKRIDNPIIIVYEDNKEMNKINGNPCTLMLDLNKNYIIGILSNTDLKKYLQVNTTVPCNLIDNIYKYSCKVKLINKISSIEKPAVKIVYEKNDFNFYSN